MDQEPIGRSPRSNPASYVGLLDLLRDLFAKLPLAKVRGYKASRFSFNVRGGRCERCQGDGQIKLDMQFMADAYAPCPSLRRPALQPRDARGPLPRQVASPTCSR